MDFKTKLDHIVQKNNSLVCIGLDSDFDKLPPHIRSQKHPQFTFNKAIIDATHDLVCAYKPNSAFYEARGGEGIEELKRTVDYIKSTRPEIVVILDAKRADIGSSNKRYVAFAFDHLGADALTVHPYLGKQAIKPFLDRVDKGLFILCRTSNPGAGEFQDLLVTESDKDTSGVTRRGSPDGVAIKKPLYQIIAEHVAKDWNYNNNCGLVVGATYPTELHIVRHIVGDLPILIPGIGIQRGDLKKTVKFGIDSQGKNAIINSSRGIIFTAKDKDFMKKAREEAKKLRDEINKYRY